MIDQRKDKRAPKASNSHVKKSMRGNKCKNTQPELLLRTTLTAQNFRGYRLHLKLPGKPDVTFVKKKICIFLNGCFWHRCPYCNLPLPKSNTAYWQIKFEKNIRRDQKNFELLTAMGWKPIIIWECCLKNNPEKALAACINLLQ